MRRITQILVGMAASVAFLLAGKPAFALQPTVQDAGEFFKEETIRQANSVIHDIYQQLHKDLVVETYPTVPKRLKAQFDQQPKARFYEKWAEDEARSMSVNGILILITKEPAYLQIVVGNQTRKRAFTADDQAQLQNHLIEAFRTKDFDNGLLKAVHLVRDRMQQNLGGAVRTPAGDPFDWEEGAAPARASSRPATHPAGKPPEPPPTKPDESAVEPPDPGADKAKPAPAQKSSGDASDVKPPLPDPKHPDPTGGTEKPPPEQTPKPQARGFRAFAPLEVCA